MFPIKYIENNMILNQQGEWWAYYELIPYNYAREFDTLKSKKVPQSLEIGLFFCQIFIFII